MVKRLRTFAPASACACARSPGSAVDLNLTRMVSGACRDVDCATTPGTGRSSNQRTSQSPLRAIARRRVGPAIVIATDSRRTSRGRRPWGARSEEHTSELQSLAYLVCRLLLEKKK